MAQDWGTGVVVSDGGEGSFRFQVSREGPRGCTAALALDFLATYSQVPEINTKSKFPFFFLSGHAFSRGWTEFSAGLDLETH